MDAKIEPYVDDFLTFGLRIFSYDIVRYLFKMKTSWNNLSIRNLPVALIINLKSRLLTLRL